MNACKVRSIRLKSTERYQRLLNKDLGTCGIKAGHVVLKPGEDIGDHTSGEREEVIIILKGKGEVRVGQANILKVEGDSVIYIPPETNHDVRNNGHNDLEYVFVTSKVLN